MRKKIQKNMLVIIFFSIAIYALGTIFLFFDTERNQSKAVVESQIQYISANYDELFAGELEFKLNPALSQTRISIIDESGKVVYDNKFPLDKIENHNDRPEVIEARLNKQGSSERVSDSVFSLTYYRANLLKDGNIIRIAIPINSLFSILKLLAPFTIFTLIFIALHAILMSRNLTKKLVAPIEKVDLKSDLSSPYPELDLYFQVMRDQKQQTNEQNQRISRRNDTINMILNTMQEGFLIVDEESKVFLANQAFLKLMNVKDYQVKDPLIRFISDDKLLAKVDQALAGKSSSYKYKLDNKTYQVYISNSSLSNKNVIILYFVDISLEYENLKYREEFSANVSHELKTPLTIIKGLSELLSNDLVMDSDVSEFGSKIENQSNRLLAMIDNIIKISQLDEAKSNLVKERINLRLLILDVLDHLKPKLDEKEIVLNLELTDIDYFGNVQMLDEMFYNLIDNAIKYNHQAGEIFISLELQANELIFTIVNDGNPIASKDRPYIFDRFYVTDLARDKKVAGTGLGLSIVKHIVLYHGGQVNLLADSKTKIRVILPN